MKRKDLARTLARQAHIPKAAAQDRVDSVVHDILKKIKAGRSVELPGLGKLVISKIAKRTQREPR
jgi:nucleoid DNA-binding protein